MGVNVFVLIVLGVIECLGLIYEEVGDIVDVLLCFVV